MPTIKGILSFPTLFTPKVAKGATEAKYSCAILLPATDPQLAQLQQEVETAKANAFPSGYTGQDECLQPYDTKYAGKEYYDPRFSGWWVFSCSAKEHDRPAVVDMGRQPIVDPANAFSGMVAYVSAGISGYTKGRGGIGGWLNGVMITDEEPPMGRLDGKPSVDQMFASVGNAPTSPSVGAPTTGSPAPAAPAPSAPTPPAPAAPQYQMTAAANGMTRDQYIAAGWSDEQLIANGLMQPPGGVAPSFAQ